MHIKGLNGFHMLKFNCYQSTKSTYLLIKHKFQQNISDSHVQIITFIGVDIGCISTGIRTEVMVLIFLFFSLFREASCGFKFSLSLFREVFPCMLPHEAYIA